MSFMFAYYAGFDAPGPDRVTVVHTCGHETIYHYGGTHPSFDAHRQEFAAEQTSLACPECSTVAELAACPPPPNPIPVAAAQGGPGRLIARDHTVVFELDGEPVLLERLCQRGRTAYTFVARILGPGALEASYLHRRQGHTYTAAEMVWLDEYAVSHIVAGYHRSYAYGATLSSWSQLERAERILGRPIYLNNDDIDHAGDERDEAETARREAALELACESGLMPGAAPADI